MDSVSVIILIIGVLLVFVGLIGLILPILPGPALIFAGLVLAAWAEDFAHVGSMTIAILAVLAILAHAIDFIAGAFGAKKFGASRWASVGALIGSIKISIPIARNKKKMEDYKKKFPKAPLLETKNGREEFLYSICNTLVSGKIIGISPESGRYIFPILTLRSQKPLHKDKTAKQLTAKSSLVWLIFNAAKGIIC